MEVLKGFHMLEIKYKRYPGAWLFQLLSSSPSTTGLALQFTLVCHNSDNLFKAFIV